MRKHLPALLTLALLGVAAAALARTGQEGKGGAAHGAHASHIMVTPEQMKWGPAPPAIPPGAQAAVIEGDPSKPGSAFAVRLKFPDGYRVPPHWHPADEKVVVLQGTLGMGLGEKFDPAAGHELPAGSYAVMPTGVRHFAWAKGETVIQVSAVGPFEVNYVNPADDPRKAAK
jgi:quercetin dioxygenase-like cupin family protein